MKLQLSEAILLGSLTFPDPTAGDIDRCAIAMALAANGAIPNPEDYKEPSVDDHGAGYEDATDEPAANLRLLVRPTENDAQKWFHAVLSHDELRSTYPWIDKIFVCPWCGNGGRALQGTALVYHPFDEHVMTGGITLDVFCSWIAAIEPPLETYGVTTLNLGLSVLFADEPEKNAVLKAALEAGMSASSYVAAAVRLAMDRGTRVKEFELAEPTIEPRQAVSYKWWIGATP